MCIRDSPGAAPTPPAWPGRPPARVLRLPCVWSSFFLRACVYFPVGYAKPEGAAGRKVGPPPQDPAFAILRNGEPALQHLERAQRIELGSESLQVMAPPLQELLQCHARAIAEARHPFIRQPGAAGQPMRETHRPLLNLSLIHISEPTRLLSI